MRRIRKVWFTYMLVRTLSKTDLHSAYFYKEGLKGTEEIMFGLDILNDEIEKL